MDLTVLVPWLSAAALILSLGTTVFTLMSTPARKTAGDLDSYKKANNEAVKQTFDTLLKHESRLQSLELEIKHLPDVEAVHRLELAMRDMQTQIAGMAASAQATERTARRVEDFLIAQAKGS